MLKSVGRYVKALWAQWKVLLTGGSVMALVAIWALATNRGLPYSAGWLILGITFVAASFLAWRHENEHVHAGQGTPSPRDERQALIASWRAMVTDVHLKRIKNYGKPVIQVLEAHPSFPSLRPYLRDDARRTILDGRTAVVARDGSAMDGKLHILLDEIDRLEHEWGLR